MKILYDNPVRYFFRLNEREISLNEHIGNKISFDFTGKIRCIICGRETPKSFFQGMCYPCFQKAPQAEECVLRPELCRAHEGIARNMNYARENCLQEHFVYLSVTDKIKVGVTRKSQIPVRWIDQGAVKAVKIASTSNRYTAGLIEVALKSKYSDKTNWRSMLSEHNEILEYNEQLNIIMTILNSELKKNILTDEVITEIKYPVLKYPDKPKNITFDKQPHIEGMLSGIKGQYLIFDDGRVINIRKHGGYEVTLRI